LLGAHPTDAEWVTRAERFPMIFVACQCGKTYVIAVQHAGRKVKGNLSALRRPETLGKTGRKGLPIHPDEEVGYRCGWRSSAKASGVENDEISSSEIAAWEDHVLCGGKLPVELRPTKPLRGWRSSGGFLQYWAGTPCSASCRRTIDIPR
jgi:hypothetical protein